MRVRDPSIRRCRAWPPYYESQPASSFRTADRKYIMWTASHWFVPAACARTRSLKALSSAKHGCGNRRGRLRIPLGRVTLRTWSPLTGNTIRTGISSVGHRSRTVFSPCAFLCGSAGRPQSRSCRPGTVTEPGAAEDFALPPSIRVCYMPTVYVAYPHRLVYRQSVYLNCLLCSPDKIRASTGSQA